MPILSQWTPAIALDIISALGFKLLFLENVSLPINNADAPMEIGLLVAAVIEPFSRKAGRRLLIFSSSGSLGPSSFTTLDSPLTSIAINSLSNLPA